MYINKIDEIEMKKFDICFDVNLITYNFNLEFKITFIDNYKIY